AYMNAIIEQARSLDGYQDSSELLQRRDQDWVLDRAGIEPRSLLDLGCGEGVATLYAARQGASVIFTDSEEDKVRSLAQQVEAVARRPFTGLVSDSDPLPLRDACADKLVCME
ncbi:methyltransferase domain-containing protein, partial [Morganella morganii]